MLAAVVLCMWMRAMTTMLFMLIWFLQVVAGSLVVKVPWSAALPQPICDDSRPTQAQLLLTSVPCIGRTD